LKLNSPPFALANSLSSNDALLLALTAALVVHSVIILGVKDYPSLHRPPKTVEVAIIHRPVQPALKKQIVNLAKPVQVNKPKPFEPVVPVKQNRPISAKKIPVIKPTKKVHTTPPVKAIPQPIQELTPKEVIPTTAAAVTPDPHVEKETPAVVAPTPSPVIPVPSPPPVIPEEDSPKVIALPPPPDVVETVPEIAPPAIEAEQKTPPAETETPPPNKNHHQTKHSAKHRQKHRSHSAPPTAILDLEAQIAQIGEKFATPVESPTQSRVKTLGLVKNHNYLARQYSADWQRKVERIGNLNYPAAAREKDFSATLVMEVGIQSDGSLHSLEIKKSSGNQALDEAAKNIVQMSTPFAPLPKALAKELDVLVIRRTWQFSDESISTH
jgi:protein TonB